MESNILVQYSVLLVGIPSTTTTPWVLVLALQMLVYSLGILVVIFQKYPKYLS